MANTTNGPLQMFTGNNSFTGMEFSRATAAKVLAILAVALAQLAATSFSHGAGTASFYSITVPTGVVFSWVYLVLAIVVAGAAYWASWNNIPDTPAPATTSAAPPTETPPLP